MTPNPGMTHELPMQSRLPGASVDERRFQALPLPAQCGHAVGGRNELPGLRRPLPRHLAVPPDAGPVSARRNDQTLSHSRDHGPDAAARTPGYRAIGHGRDDGCGSAVA